MRRLPLAAALALLATPVLAEQNIGLVMGDRFEYRESEDSFLWDVQGWYGGDINKVAFKTEGRHLDNDFEHSEIQLLYRRAISPYFDLQLGARHSWDDSESVNSAVVGIIGDAPYGFEIDASAFLTENGDGLARAEVERDILLTQRLVIQPRIEINAAFSDVPDLGISSGIYELQLDLRLRYEFSRKLAPYIGVSHEEIDDFNVSETSFVLGMRFWF